MAETTSGDEARSAATAAGRRHPDHSSPRWIAPAALVIALVAVAVAIWALVDKAPANEGPQAQGAEAGSEVTPEQTAASKAQVCAAFNTVALAVQLQTNANLGPDPVAATAVAGNARLALLGGGLYLESQLDEATSPELADPIRAFASTLKDIGISALTGVTNQDPVQQGRLTEGDRLRQQIVPLCE